MDVVLIMLLVMSMSVQLWNRDIKFTTSSQRRQYYVAPTCVNFAKKVKFGLLIIIHGSISTALFRHDVFLVPSIDIVISN